MGLLLWLLNHPYQGVWHDAVIYGLLAAHWLHPEALANDLFFRFGSQGDWSLFTPIYGMSVGWLGLERAARWVAFSGGAAWVAAATLTAGRMLGPGSAARVAALVLAVMTVSYSPNQGTFVLTENFATARCWALPLGLASVAALAASHRGWAFLAAFASLSLHPLLGIWPIALCLIARLRMLHVIALALLAVLGAMLIGIADADLPYLRLMSGDWLAFVRDEAPDVVFQAQHNRLAEYGAALSCLLLGARWGGEQCRPIYQRVLILSVAGLAVAAIASFWWPVEILVQGQAWRVCWLLLPLALIALLDVGKRIGRGSLAGPAILGLAGAVASGGASVWLPAAYLLGLGALVPAARWRQLGALLERRRSWLGTAALLLWLMMLPGQLAQWELAGSKWMEPWWSGAEWLHGMLAGGSWHIAVLAGLAAAWRPAWQSALPSLAALAVLLACGIWVSSIWDRRIESRSAVESCYLDSRCQPHVFRERVAVGEAVFWNGREPRIWFELNRASYYGTLQRIGAVFSRAKYDEWRRRDAVVAEGREPLHPCTDPILDWVVLPAAVPGKTPREMARGAWLYACADFRAVPPAPTFSGVR